MIHEALRQVQVAEQNRQLERATLVASARRARRAADRTRADVPVSLRLCTVHDNVSLEQLAALESRTLPSGSFVIAEVGGKLVAAAPLDGGAPLADPFYATAHLLPLLRLRARQISVGTRRRGLIVRRGSTIRGV